MNKRHAPPPDQSGAAGAVSGARQQPRSRPPLPQWPEQVQAAGINQRPATPPPPGQSGAAGAGSGARPKQRPGKGLPRPPRQSGAAGAGAGGGGEPLDDNRPIGPRVPKVTFSPDPPQIKLIKRRASLLLPPSVIPEESKASLASLIPGGGQSPVITEHTIYISSIAEVKSLMSHVGNFLRSGKIPAVSSVMVQRDEGEGGVYTTPQPNTTEFTFWTQGGGVIAIEDMDGDQVTKDSDPKPAKGGSLESETTAL